mmetsp:Transcript_19608/g.28854  ORF Transcript_19608/g.28854 Transcript_19608/m.28854 type:complete len:510 (+) Transcript_19608:226-1755(+)
MRSTRRLSQPVLTFLTQSPQHSRRAQSLLQHHFNVQACPDPDGSVRGVANNGTVDKMSTDGLNDMFPPFPFSNPTTWHSALSMDTTSTAFFHFLSLDDGSGSGSVTRNSTNIDDGTDTDGISLIAITDSNAHSKSEMVQETRDIIAAQAHHSDDNGHGAGINKMKFKGMKLLLSSKLRRHISASDVGLKDGLPLLHLPVPQTQSQTQTSPKGKENASGQVTSASASTSLREIVIPFFDNVTYPNGHTVLSALSQSMMDRPKTGLYQWPSSSSNANDSKNSDKESEGSGGGIILRPLPLGSADLFLPPPSLVFSCSSLKDEIHAITTSNTPITSSPTSPSPQSSSSLSSFPLSSPTLHPVGRNSNSPGQLMVIHPSLHGLDVRLCESKTLSPFFAEAQDSLLAGSLGDLQNVNVVVEGGRDKQKNKYNSNKNAASNSDSNVEVTKTQGNRNSGNGGKVDAMNGLGDCWVEFRASMKQPKGFFKGMLGGNGRGKIPSRSDRIAKPPDLPYE